MGVLRLNQWRLRSTSGWRKAGPCKNIHTGGHWSAVFKRFLPDAVHNSAGAKERPAGLRLAVAAGKLVVVLKMWSPVAT